MSPMVFCETNIRGIPSATTHPREIHSSKDTVGDFNGFIVALSYTFTLFLFVKITEFSWPIILPDEVDQTTEFSKSSAHELSKSLALDKYESFALEFSLSVALDSAQSFAIELSLSTAFELSESIALELSKSIAN